ncbi:MAG: glycoside hydrolase family 140 protein [Kiritimatiellae bacterium]|nr:glycoside hydrolase family 140 protein [Kiritimatiellia bacterium]
MAAAQLARLTVSDGGRHLAREGGAPFFWLGDTAWCLYKMNPAEVAQYMADRAAKRFNVVQAMAIRTHGGTANYRGDEPFTGTDPVRLHEAYWAHIDAIVDLAGENGLYVALATMWGHNVNTLFPNPAHDNYEYGRQLGQRYAGRNHVIWIVCGEYGKIRADWAKTKDQQITEAHLALFRALARGLKAGHGGRHLMTIHPIFSSSRHFHHDDWLDFNMEQTWLNFHACPGRVSADYQMTPVKPALNGEPGYEGMGRPDLAKEVITPWHARLQAYWCLFSGACGHTYGADGLWQFRCPPKSPTWTEAMAYEGGAQMQHVRALMESVPFGKGVPDQTLVASPIGTPKDKTYVAAMRAQDGSFALVYLTQGGSVTLELEKLGAGRPLQAEWFDPRTGARTAIGEQAAAATASFDAPSRGAGCDWVLVLAAQ